MATKEMSYNGYLYLLNRIAYWLQKNNKKVTTKKEYTIGKESKTLEVILNTIKKHGTNYNSNEYIGRYVEHIITTNKDDNDLPNYVLSKDGKRQYSKAAYKDMVKRVTAFRKKEGRNPKTVKGAYITVTSSTSTSTSTSIKSKYGHATKSGCDNRGQNNGVYCGPHSMQEVIRNLTGKVIKQSTLASWAGTTSGGTDHQGLETAIAKASKQTGVKLTCKWYNFSDLGWNGINNILKSSNKDCIIHNCYRLKWGHYEVINSISGSNVKVQNSLGDSGCGSCYCGYVEDRSTSEFRSYISGISQKSVLVVTRG